MKLYVVEMLRFGNREKHSYVLGVYSTREIAMSEADKEEEYRGGKYVADIGSYDLDNKED